MNPAPARPAPVWDRFVRVFHWSLVGCIAVDFFLVDDGDALHRWLGYAATALVLARIGWGFFGSPHARFADFFPTPARLRAHLRELAAGRFPAHEGHNPLGALMMLALMAMVLALGATGFLLTTDAYWGDEAMEDLHGRLADGLLLLVGLHVAAALVMGRLERTHLVRAMFTGTKDRW